MVKKWLAGGDESVMERSEARLVRMRDEPYNEKVEKWLRGGGERSEGGDVL